MILNQFSELNRYLSSGTIKGINTFLYAIRIFNNGGYLIIDELENHFNREIISTLIHFYMDKKVNKKGATLIFQPTILNCLMNLSATTIYILSEIVKE